MFLPAFALLGLVAALQLARRAPRPQPQPA
jgi:hypothetical protein